MFMNIWLLQRSCEVQVAADATGKPLIPLSIDIANKAEELGKIQMAGAPMGEREFNAMVRKIDKIDPSYRD